MGAVDRYPNVGAKRDGVGSARERVPCLSYQDGLQQVVAVRERRQQRGYRLVREEPDTDSKDLSLR